MTSSQFTNLATNLVARIECWPIAGTFTISRGAKTEAVTVVAEVSRGGYSGRGECVPYPRYGETPEATLAALQAMQEPLRHGLDRASLQTAMPRPPDGGRGSCWNARRQRPAPRPIPSRSARLRRWRRPLRGRRTARC